MTTPSLSFLRIKAVALPVSDLPRALDFYTATLALPPIYEDGQPTGARLGETYLLLKPDWYAPPSNMPSPRITIETADARQLEAALLEKGVRISDPVEVYGDSQIGAFLDSEGNKLWFCSGPGPSLTR